MKMCPDCRAGKRFIESERVTERLSYIELEYECVRCGHTKTERVDV